MDDRYLHGIDVSKWQKTIGWPRVKVGPYGNFAYIKACEAMYTDIQFDINWKAAKDVGVPRGAYFFFRPTVDITKQVEYFYNLIREDIGELRPSIDLEDAAGLTPTVFLEKFIIALNLLESNLGVAPVVYTSKSFWNAHLMAGKIKTKDYSFLKKYPLWVAHYNAFITEPLSPNDFEWGMWQYSSTGNVDGISTPVDLNRMLKSKQDRFFLPNNIPLTLEQRVNRLEILAKEKGWF